MRVSLKCVALAAQLAIVACLTRAELEPETPISEPANEPQNSMSAIETPILEMLVKMTDEDPERKHIKEMLYSQEQIEDITPGLSTVEILVKSGFRYDVHSCVSLDGYVTQLVRIVNPLVDRRHLRKTPVVFYTGQGVSPAALLAVAPRGSRRPFQWTRKEGSDESLLSEAREHLGGNRSLALMLSNYGFDVWLVPTRGVDRENRERRKPGTVSAELPQNVPPSKLVKSEILKKKKEKLDFFAELFLKKFEGFMKENQLQGTSDMFDKMQAMVKKSTAENYWSFSNDEIIEQEFSFQLDKVRSVSGAKKVSLISYSNGAFVVFGFLARQPAYAQENLDAIINLAPAVFVNRYNMVLSLGAMVSQLNPPDWPFPDDQMGGFAKSGLTSMCRSKAMRYSVCKMMLNQLYGQSDLFRSRLDLAVFDYIGRPVSGNSLRQTLQVAQTSEMREFDRGFLGNMIFYGTPSPTSYSLRDVNHEHLYIISGTEDAIADTNSLTLLVGSIGCKPEAWLRVPFYNHLDLLVAHDTAEQVNLPILKILVDRDIELDYYREDGHGAEHEDASASLGELGASHEKTKQLEADSHGEEVDIRQEPASNYQNAGQQEEHREPEHQEERHEPEHQHEPESEHEKLHETEKEHLRPEPEQEHYNQQQEPEHNVEVVEEKAEAEVEVEEEKEKKVEHQEEHSVKEERKEEHSHDVHFHAGKVLPGPIQLGLGLEAGFKTEEHVKEEHHVESHSEHSEILTGDQKVEEPQVLSATQTGHVDTEHEDEQVDQSRDQPVEIPATGSLRTPASSAPTISDSIAAPNHGEPTTPQSTGLWNFPDTYFKPAASQNAQQPKLSLADLLNASRSRQGGLSETSGQSNQTVAAC